MMPAIELDRPRRGDIVTDSDLLGTLAVPEAQVYAFESGIYGFPTARTFALLPAERPGFFWLQSVECSALTFLLVDPFRFVGDYEVDLDFEELGELGSPTAADVLLLAIVTLPRRPEDEATLNLQGPLAFNVEERRGRQVVTHSPYGVRHPLDLTRAP